jgi:hypothetical protein
MKEHHVLGAREPLEDVRITEPGLYAPGCGEFGVHEHGAFEPH